MKEGEELYPSRYEEKFVEQSIKDTDELSKLLLKAIKAIDEIPDENKLVLEDGTKYTKVVQRNKIFKQIFGMRGRIVPEVVFFKDNVATIRADISFRIAGQWELYGSGHSSKMIDPHGNFQNIESVETAAIGRALASIGLSGDEYASDVEIASAVSKKTKVSGAKNTPSSVKKAAENRAQDKNDDKKIIKSSLKRLNKLIESSEDYSEEDIKSIYNVKKLEDLNRGQYKDIDLRLRGEPFNVRIDDIKSLISESNYAEKRLLSDYGVADFEELDKLPLDKKQEIFTLLKNRKKIVEKETGNSEIESDGCDIL